MNGERLAETKRRSNTYLNSPPINEWGAPNGNKNEEAKPI